MDIQTGRQIEVLVIDDGHLNRRLSERMLKHLGCGVTTAEDVHSGVAALRAAPIDIVFSDVEMPDMNGDEAIRLFRETARQAHPDRPRELVIADVSGQALGPDRAAYLEAGFDDYVAKPISVDRLSEVLEQWRDTTEQPGRSTT